MDSLLLKVRKRIQSLETSRHLDYWLQDAVLAEGAQGNLTLKCPNAFSMQWLSGRHGEVLANLFREEMGRDLCLTFQIEPASEGTGSGGERLETGRDPSQEPEKSEATGSGAVSRVEPFAGWNPGFCFETFVTGPSNAFACSAAKEVSRQDQSPYNPLLIHAPTGLGKTHLGQAVGRRLFEGNGHRRILWNTAESFLAEMIRHIKNKDVPTFKSRYRDACDVLILDDIQFLKGKTALQAELCHTLDILLNRGKLVVLLGNLPARGNSGLDENLESRIYSGLAVTIEPPEYETRLAILRQLAGSCGLPVSEECLAAVARCVRSHVRDLQGAFKRLMALRSLAREAIDPETVERHFGDLPSASGRPIDPKRIRDHVAGYFGLPPERLASRSRKRDVHYPRQVGMYLARKHTHASLESIGRLYNRGHGSALNALQSLEKKMRSNPRVAREVGFIEEKLLEQL
jgi:chromosomal replication initiator protein